MTTPKLHTSLAEEKVRKAMASGAVQRIGIFPPCDGHTSVESFSPARQGAEGRDLGWETRRLAGETRPPPSKSTCSDGGDLHMELVWRLNKRQWVEGLAPSRCSVSISQQVDA